VVESVVLPHYARAVAALLELPEHLERLLFFLPLGICVTARHDQNEWVILSRIPGNFNCNYL